MLLSLELRLSYCFQLLDHMNQQIDLQQIGLKVMIFL